MYPAKDLISDFERNRRILHSQTEGLTHADSLLQPSGANCLNWTIGHIVVHRDKVIEACGGEPILAVGQVDRYTNESDPITEEGPDVVPLVTLMDQLDQTQERLAQVVADADLDAIQTVNERDVPLWKRVHFWYFHDTYHTGQTEMLRGLAGYTDQVI
jgi:uncharacterized damage-inducible protein DinB